MGHALDCLGKSIAVVVVSHHHSASPFSMEYARARLPRLKAKLIPLVFGAGFFAWFIYWLSGQRLEGPFAHRERHGYRPPPRLRPYPPSHAHTVWNSRAEQVKEAFLHAYRGYQQHAASCDELLPITNTSVNKWVVVYNNRRLMDEYFLVLMDGVFN